MDNILGRYEEISDQIEATIKAYHNRSISWFMRVFRWLFITWWRQEPIFIEHLKSFKALYEEAQQSLVHASKEDTSVLLTYDCQLAGSVSKIISMHESFIIRAISAQVEDLLKKIKDWQENRVACLKSGFLDNRCDSFHSDTSEGTGSTEYLYSPGSELTDAQEVYSASGNQEETQEKGASYSHWTDLPFFRARSPDSPYKDQEVCRVSEIQEKTQEDGYSYSHWPDLSHFQARLSAPLSFRNNYQLDPINTQYHLKK